MKMSEEPIEEQVITLETASRMGGGTYLRAILYASPEAVVAWEKILKQREKKSR